MNRKILLGLGTLASVVLGGCSHTAGLRTEIAQIETRLQDLETEIAAGTPTIGQPGRDIRTRIAYRPFQAWSEAFGTKTATFQQTARGGDLSREDRDCRVWPPRANPGYRVFIHEPRSTRARLTLGPMAFTPTPTGIDFSTKVVLDAHTQVAAAGRGCVGGWSPTVSIGADAHTRPNVTLRLNVTQGEGLAPRYDLVVASPNRLDVELQTGIQVPIFGNVRIRETSRANIGGKSLANGNINMLIQNSTDVVWPDGETRTYRFSTTNPVIRTSLSGIAFETDVDLVREGAEMVADD